MTVNGDDRTQVASFRDALRTSNPALSRFNPLSRILTVDDFNHGTNGWVELNGNYDGQGNLDTVDPFLSDFRPPQLSNVNFFDVGTHGAMSGTYAMKLATRPYAGHTATAIRRLTMSGRGPLQIEAYFTYKSETNIGGGADADSFGDISYDGNSHPSETQFGAFTVATDLCGDNGLRYHTVARYQNTDFDGNFVKQVMYPVVPEPTPREQFEGKGEKLPYAADFTAPNPDDWRTIGEPFTLCYNEVPTKVNWHYLRWTMDTEKRKNIELQINNKLIDMRDVPVPPYEESYDSLENLLNFYFSVRTLSGKRNFLYLDTVVISADW